ncbi:hypothetical protein VPH49_21860 [Pseudomonas luteola]|uniref:hypothetical protein n=1 Tax=Pseudomonas luteola TaxID=47886 RepID=UPI003A8C4C6E
MSHPLAIIAHILKKIREEKPGDTYAQRLGREISYLCNVQETTDFSRIRRVTQRRLIKLSRLDAMGSPSKRPHDQPEEKIMTKIELENGKYTVVHDNGDNFHALRHGEPWRNLTGDSLVLAMTDRIADLEAHIRKTVYELDKLSEAQSRYMKAEAENAVLKDRVKELEAKPRYENP